MGCNQRVARCLKTGTLGTELLCKARPQQYFLPWREENLPQTAAGDGLVQGATSCVTTNHTQLLSGNISQSRHMVMSWRGGTGSGSGMGAIRLGKKMEGEEDGQEGATERESLRGRDQRDGAWPQMCDGWDPSSTLYEATFTVGQTAGARGRAPRQRAGCKTGDQGGGGGGGGGAERGREGLVVCSSCHETWETPFWLIGVNETTQNEKVQIHGKSHGTEVQWEVSGRAREGGADRQRDASGVF